MTEWSSRVESFDDEKLEIWGSHFGSYGVLHR